MSSSDTPSRCLIKARSELPCATTATRLPERIAGAMASFQNGTTRLTVSWRHSLRALIKHLDGVSDDDIVGLNIPTGWPLVYELDDDLRPISNRYLGDPAEIEKALAAVAAQGKAKPAA